MQPEIVHGAIAIARVIGKKPKATFLLLQSGAIPGAFRMGRGWALSLPRFNRAVHGEGADIAPLKVGPPTPTAPPTASRRQAARARKQRVAERARGGRA
jgi:hypothetical protein